MCTILVHVCQTICWAQVSVTNVGAIESLGHTQGQSYVTSTGVCAPNFMCFQWEPPQKCSSLEEKKSWPG